MGRVVLGLALCTATLVACSSGPDGDAGDGASVAAPDASVASSPTDPASPSVPGAAPSPTPDGATPLATGSVVPTDPATPTGEAPAVDTDPTTTPAPPASSPDVAAPPPVPSDEICRLVPAAAVADALGVDEVTAAPRDSNTPQCAYAFTGADDVPTNATVSVLTDADVDGRRGEEAFTYVVDLNLRAAGEDDVQQTPVALGDRAVLLSGGSLHFGVVQYEGRVVTTIVRRSVAEVPAATALLQATTPLAP